MKIGIDARLFGPKQGGLGRYVEQLILNLEKLNPPAEFFIFLRKDNWDEYTPALPNFKKILADVSWYGFDEQTKLHQIFERESLDLMHFPHWNVPIFYNRPYVLTVHDLLLLTYPTKEASKLGYFSYFFKQLGFKQVLSNATKKAKKILTVSEFSKNDIIQKLKTPSEKVVVTHLAPKEKTFPQPIDLKKLGINKPFCLYVGVAYPHKNLDKLLEAWEIFLQNNQTHQLVLCGKRNFFYDRLIDNFKQLFQEQKVVFTDYLPDNQLADLYSKASLYVFPSLYEGFGLPALEAMQYGVPVISSNSSCLPEILQGAALYFDPSDVNQIAMSLETGIKDDNLRRELKKLGHYLEEKYSWNKVAKSTWEIYKSSV